MDLKLKNMWSDDRTRVAMAARFINEWADELDHIEDHEEVDRIAQELKKIALRLNSVHAKSRSFQASPDLIDECINHRGKILDTKV